MTIGASSKYDADISSLKYRGGGRLLGTHTAGNNPADASVLKSLLPSPTHPVPRHFVFSRLSTFLADIYPIINR